MVNNTATYWSVGSESLHTFARSIETLGGTVKPPTFRGSNIEIPSVPGERYISKVPGAQVISLSMWVRGVLNDSQGGTRLSTAEFDKNWLALTRLLWNPRRLIPLTKRFYDMGVLRSATAQVEFNGGLEPTMIGRKAARTTVDLRIPQVYFFDDVVQTFNLVQGDNTVNIRGTAPTRRITLTINGGRDNVTVRVKTPPPAHSITYRDSLVSGEYATIDIEAMTVRKYPGAVNTEIKVTNTGAPYWLELEPGDNVVNVSGLGTGSIQLQVRGAWL